jgi:hypothetical protein
MGKHRADPELRRISTMKNTYKTQVYIWSDIGHTPITNRPGDYQDTLVDTIIECTDPEDALAKVLEIKKATPHACQCYFNMIDYPNQNTKSKYCHYGKQG